MMSRVKLICGLMALSMITSLFGFGKRTFFAPRTQRLNPSRQAAGNWFMYEKYDRCLQNQVSVSFDYDRTTHPGEIANYLFGQECVTFSGSRVLGRRGPDEVLADYFGLPGNFKSLVQFQPRISNVVFDVNWYLNLDRCCHGLYMRVDVPIVHTKWDLHFKEIVINAGSDVANSTNTVSFSYPAGYLSDSNIQRSQLAFNMRQAFEGRTPFGDVRDPLAYGTIFGRQTLARAAEIRVEFGENVIWTETGHLALKLFFALPTGNRSEARFLFEPIIGNNHHWELGCGINAHGNILTSANQAHELDFYFDSNIAHLFTDRQRRSYDFVRNGFGSRYMLLAEIFAPSDNLLVNGQVPDDQYQGILSPAINHTSLESDIKIAVQADITGRFEYQWSGLEAGFGYTFFARSAEQLTCRESFESGRWAVKGDAQLYGFEAMTETPVALRTSQHRATVYGGQFVNGQQNTEVTNIESYQNLNADNPASAQTASGGVLNNITSEDTMVPGFVQATVMTSNPPLFLTDGDIDNQSGLVPRAMTHSFFWHAGYTWVEIVEFMPFIGIGGFMEFAHLDPYDNSGYSQWGVWFKTSLAF